eukprot:Em0018g317a
MLAEIYGRLNMSLVRSVARAIMEREVVQGSGWGWRRFAGVVAEGVCGVVAEEVCGVVVEEVCGAVVEVCGSVVVEVCGVVVVAVEEVCGVVVVEEVCGAVVVEEVCEARSDRNKAMLLCELFSSLSTDTFIAMATSVRENLVTRHMRLSTDVGEEFGDGEVGCLGLYPVDTDI